MKNFHIETIQLDGRQPYLKVYFEDVVDKEIVRTWLNLQGFIKRANVNEDEYSKVSASVYIYPGSNIREIQNKLETILQRFDI